MRVFAEVAAAPMLLVSDQLTSPFDDRAAQAHGANGRQPDVPTTKVRGEIQKVTAAAE